MLFASLLYLFCAGFSAQAIETEAVISVRAHTEVDGKGQISLSDIADFSELSPKLRSELAPIELGDAPRAGESRNFTDIGLTQIFRAKIKELEQKWQIHIQLKIPPQVVVMAKAPLITESQLEIALLAKIKEICESCQADISNLQFPQQLASLPEGSHWEIKFGPELPKGAFSVPLEIRNRQGNKKRYWLSGQMLLKKKTPVALRNISMGEAISTLDWSMQLRDITYFTDSAPESTELTSAWAAKPIQEGEAIGRSAFRRVAAIRYGDPVHITTGNQDWQISMEGTSQQSGFVGDRIQVKIPRTQKIISGLLREDNTVEVQ